LISGIIEYWLNIKDSLDHRCTGVRIFGNAKYFCPNLILFFSK